MNISAFLARCTTAGLYNRVPDLFDWVATDIAEAFDDNEGEKSTFPRDIRFTAAAMWICHAGEAIHDSMVKANRPEWGVDLWRGWAFTLSEELDLKKVDDKAKSAIAGALRNMLVLGL